MLIDPLHKHIQELGNQLFSIAICRKIMYNVNDEFLYAELDVRTDTGFYYASTRYCDHEVGRFINTDDPEILLEDRYDSSNGEVQNNNAMIG